MTADNITDTLRQVEAARIDNMSKAEKAAWLRERSWRLEGGGKTPQRRSPGGVVASSASVACRLYVLADTSGTGSD